MARARGLPSPRQLAQIRLSALRELYSRDFLLYANEQLKIQTKKAGQVVALDPFAKPLQRMFVERATAQVKEVGYVDGNILKGRQQGSSTITQAYQFWKASTTPNFNTLLIAQDEPTTKAIFEKARFFYEHLHPSVKPDIRHSNRRELVFAAPEHKKKVVEHGLGSRMDFQNAMNMMAGTGTTRQGLHLSECSKFRQDDIDLMVASLYPSIYRGPGSLRIKESTAFIGGTWFRACCDAARNEEVPEFWLFAPFYLEPDNVFPLDPKNPDDKALARMTGLTPEERRIVNVAKRGQKKDKIPPFEIRPEQLKFRRITIAQPGWDDDLFEEEFPTEYETAWISRDNRAFNHERLYAMREQVRQPARLVEVEPGPRLFDDPNMRMHEDLSYIAIWEEPILGEDYDIGVDCSAGIEGGDWQAAVVWKRRTREQVAEVHLHLDGLDYGTKLFWLGLYYYNAQIAVEWTGGYGVSVEGALKRLEYPNVYLWRHRDEGIALPTKKTGWHTSRETKAYMVGLFRSFINHGQVTIRSQILLNEMFDFIQLPYGDGYDYRSATGHDDLVMAGGIGLVISDDENQFRLEEASNIGRYAKGMSGIAQAVQGLVGLAYTDSFDPRARQSNSKLLMEVRGR